MNAIKKRSLIIRIGERFLAHRKLRVLSRAKFVFCSAWLKRDVGEAARFFFVAKTDKKIYSLEIMRDNVV